MKNIVVRSLSGLAYVVLVLGCLLWCKYSFAALMLTIMIWVMHEFFRLTLGTSYRFSQVLTIIAGAILFLLTFCYKAFDIRGSLIMLALIPIGCVMVDSLYVRDKSEYGKFTYLYTSVLYIAIPISMTNIVAFKSTGEYTGLALISLLILTWSIDSFSYISGSLLSKKFPKKLFPTISPKKSWVGFIGGLLCTIGVAVLLAALGMLHMKWWMAALLGIVVAISGVYGDLVESQWKRYYEVKDFGHAMPGHGGILDRFDSSLFALPAGIIFLELLHLL